MKRRLVPICAAAALLAGCSANATPAGSAASAGTAATEAPAAPSTQRLVAAAALTPCPQVPTGSGAAATAGPRLPKLTLDCLGVGPPVPLAGLRGPALVNMWASWCKPCRQEMPRLQALAARAGNRLLVLGVVTDDDRRNALSAAAGLGVHYPSVLDSSGAVRRSYGYPGPPITLLIDRNGAVVHRILGAVPALPDLLQTVSRQLGVRV